MPFPAIGGVLLGVIVAAGFRILTALGIGFVTFSVDLPAFYNFVTGYFSALPPDIFQLVGILRVDQCITLIFSASAARLIYKIAAAPLVSLGG